jgi:hypothetical protein
MWSLRVNEVFEESLLPISVAVLKEVKGSGP